jgi:hypothetical protein
MPIFAIERLYLAKNSPLARLGPVSLYASGHGGQRSAEPRSVTRHGPWMAVRSPSRLSDRRTKAAQQVVRGKAGSQVGAHAHLLANPALR